MKHLIEWRDDAINAAPEERVSVGDLRLFVNDLNVTQHLLDGQVGDHLTIALYGLAHGVVHDWWTIFGARDRDISLMKYRSGYLFPDIRLRFDGASFEISASQRVYENPDLRFWGGTTEVMTRKEGEAWLTHLVQDILARLTAQGIPETSAALRWRRVQDSRQSDERVFCEAAGGLGLDPYQITDDAADFIEKAEHLFQDESLVEFVSGAADCDKSKLLGWVERMADESDPRYRLADLRPLVDTIVDKAPSRTGEAAWARGYRRARAMRRQLGLEAHHRFSSFEDLAKTLGAHHTYSLAPTVDGIRALRREDRQGIHLPVRNHGTSSEAATAHLFALARAIGDATCFPEPQMAPINGLRSAFRQAAGRAFAAEFLAPIDEIHTMRNDKRDIFSIADEFAVSTTVIKRQMENSARIAGIFG